MNIQCKQCGDDTSWEFVSCHDSPKSGYAYNLYQCSCGALLKEDIWKNSGVTWILENGEVTHDVVNSK